MLTKAQIIMRDFIPEIHISEGIPESTDHIVFGGYGSKQDVYIKGSSESAYWSFLAYKRDWDVWSVETCITHIRGKYSYINDLLLKREENKRSMAAKEDAQRAGREMGDLMVAFLRTDVPFMSFYDLGGKFAVWDGYSGENVLAYVKGFASVFAEHNAVNRKQITQPKEEF